MNLFGGIGLSRLIRRSGQPRPTLRSMRSRETRVKQTPSEGAIKSGSHFERANGRFGVGKSVDGTECSGQIPPIRINVHGQIWSEGGPWEITVPRGRVFPR